MYVNGFLDNLFIGLNIVPSGLQHFPIPGLSIPYAAALLDHIIQLLNIKLYNGGSASSSFNLESISISWHGDEFIVMGDQDLNLLMIQFFLLQLQ